jgi:hypothetical protein
MYFPDDRACIVKESGYNLLQPPKLHRNISPSSQNLRKEKTEVKILKKKALKDLIETVIIPTKSPLGNMDLRRHVTLIYLAKSAGKQ